MKRVVHLPIFAFVALAGIMQICGCVAIDIGKPTVYEHTNTYYDTSSTPSAIQVETVRTHVQQIGPNLIVGISADVQEEYPKKRKKETTTIRIQKRLGIGFFPGASELYLKPHGALDPAPFRERLGKHGSEYALYHDGNFDYAGFQLFALIASCGIIQVAGTVNTLLCEPFAGWSCYHDFTDEDCLEVGRYSDGYRVYADATKSPKIRAFKAFLPEERKRMGVRTCYDDSSGGLSMLSGIAHAGLIGCHKHQAVFVESAKAGLQTETGYVETKRRTADVAGPFVAELLIPTLGYVQKVRVEKGVKRVSFRLPLAERKCAMKAVVRFWRDTAEMGSDVTKGALEKVAGKRYQFDVTLQGGAMPSVSVPTTISKAAGGQYEVVKITPSREGRYEVRVRIADKSKTFDVGWVVESDVKRMIREDYANRHPGTGIQYVRELVEWETEEDGAILVYRGWAFSARPVSDGWSYNAGTRRGRVRLRISEGMPADEAKRWARENIEAIVKEKNVVLEAGGTPPEGALYRSLGEVLENGVLTVEFETVE